MSNTYLAPAMHRFAATHGHSVCKHKFFLLRCFILVVAAWASLYCNKAHSATVCMPQGYDLFPTMPDIISMSQGPFGGGDKMLFDTSVTAGATSACSNDPNVALDFIIPALDVFTYLDSTDIYPQASLSRVKMVYSAKSPLGALTPANYALILYLYIVVECSGANITADVITSGQFRVTGLSACNRFTVTYQVSIYQNNTAYTAPNLTSIREGGTRGYRLRASLLDGRLNTLASQLTTLSGSPIVRYMVGVYCTYSLSRNTVPVGNINDYAMLTDNFGNTFTINVQNCQNATGRQLSIFWRFDNPDPGDSSRMQNSAAGGTDSVVGRVDCGGTLARHNQQLVISTNLQGNTSFNCYAGIVPRSSITHYTQIQPGPYKGIAYLVFQFN